MKKSILITAVSGTGKSTVCKALGEIGYNAIDIESIDGLYELVNEKTGEAIPGSLKQISEGVDWNCNKAKLKQLINSQATDLAFYCGGMSNTDDIWDIFDLVVVLTISDQLTVQRLLTRGSGEFGSTKLNREWLLSWKHDLENGWLKKGGVRVDAESNPTSIAEAIVKSIRYAL